MISDLSANFEVKKMTAMKVAENADEVGDEVEVVFEDDAAQRGRGAGADEMVDLLVEVEDDGDGDHQQDGEDIRAEEFTDDVSVYPREFEGGDT